MRRASLPPSLRADSASCFRSYSEFDQRGWHVRCPNTLSIPGPEKLSGDALSASSVFIHFPWVGGHVFAKTPITKLVFGVPVESAFFVKRSGLMRRTTWFDTIPPSSCHIGSVPTKGRGLGFDNAHSNHERHYMGDVKPVKFRRYLATAKRFYREADLLRRSYED